MIAGLPDDDCQIAGLPDCNDFYAHTHEDAYARFSYQITTKK